MEDTESTTTSVDDKTDDFGDSPTRDALAEGLIGLLRPAVEQLDERVKLTRAHQNVKNQMMHTNWHKCPVNVFMASLNHPGIFRISQIELRQQIDSLAEDLRRISESQHSMYDLDGYVKKLMNAKRRVMLVNNILQNAQERLNRINQNVARETTRRKALLETVPTPATTPS